MDEELNQPLSGIFRYAEELSKEDSDTNGSPTTFEDQLTENLRSAVTFYDLIYLFQSIGIIKKDNVIYKALAVGKINSGSRLLFLLLVARKTFLKLLRLVRLWYALKNVLPPASIKKKYNETKSRVKRSILRLSVDLLDTLVYLIVVLIDLFKFKVSDSTRKLSRLLFWILPALNFAH
ncbi:uncharacterized protein Ecym_1012 [Eremothecium cymbalariae DBVPG|uniref:Uncharacterized protein n=1 Tax=Eremothecium cymbalariae (strain CBS 270.75 / DBVPG 7215 / KCTC 17166 / NRRL Y-17582) TaxID=931890 RepID=G8JM11_ERECY|nr:hypothetical protein Ecym_1012 [Eremothecium cymbalariae DBVPG\